MHRPFPYPGCPMWFFPGAGDALRSFQSVVEGQPLCALVTAILPESSDTALLNVVVFDPAGNSWGRHRIELYEGNVPIADPDASRLEWIRIPMVDVGGDVGEAGGVSTAQPETAGGSAIDSPFQTLKAAIAADPAYAWSWLCNLAMPIKDAIGVSHEQANIAGAYLMQYLWGVDVTTFPEYQDLQKQWAAPDAQQEQTYQADVKDATADQAQARLNTAATDGAAPQAPAEGGAADANPAEGPGPSGAPASDANVTA